MVTIWGNYESFSTVRIMDSLDTILTLVPTGKASPVETAFQSSPSTASSLGRYRLANLPHLPDERVCIAQPMLSTFVKQAQQAGPHQLDA